MFWECTFWVLTFCLCLPIFASPDLNSHHATGLGPSHIMYYIIPYHHNLQHPPTITINIHQPCSMIYFLPIRCAKPIRVSPKIFSYIMGLSNPCHMMIQDPIKFVSSWTHFQNQKIHEWLNHFVSTYTIGRGTFDPSDLL